MYIGCAKIDMKTYSSYFSCFERDFDLSTKSAQGPWGPWFTTVAPESQNSKDKAAEQAKKEQVCLKLCL